MNLKKLLCSLLTVTTTVMGFQGLLVRTAFAAPSCSAYSTSDQCTTVKVGANTVSYPKMQWSLVAQDASATFKSMLTEAETSGLDRNDLTGNASASVVGLSAAQVPAALSSFPSNVPMVVGRYEPMSKTLRVDVFKIERLMVNGKLTNALYQSTFSPAYGDYWKAAGTYLSADMRKTGTAVGPNPFSAFAQSGDDEFHNISFKGAMVVLGHAQRYAGSPISILVNNVPSTEQYTRKSGGLFKKKVTQYVDYYVTPEYYLGAPQGMQGGVAVSYCANDPSSSSCANYEVASSGVTFMKLEGGNLAADRVAMHQWSQSKSGFTLLAVFVIAFVVAFAFAAIGPVMAAGTTATTGTVSAGFWTNLASMATAGGVGSTSVLGAAALEAGIYTTVTGAAGSGFGGVYGSGSGIAYAQELALDVPGDLGHVSAEQYRDVMLGKRGSNLAGGQFNRVTGRLEDTIAPVKTVLVGKCDSNKLLKDCTAESGIVPRADQYTTFNSVEFVRDNGKPTRASGF